ncbi:MAG: hypothetical protein E7266_04745 [Lachnospiraceae bacterium]|nr:hypothetical protein [Lachnospiraceae bacterium]
MLDFIAKFGIYGIPVLVGIIALICLIIFFCISKQEKKVRKVLMIAFISLSGVAFILTVAIKVLTELLLQPIHHM